MRLCRRVVVSNDLQPNSGFAQRHRLTSPVEHVQRGMGHSVGHSLCLSCKCPGGGVDLADPYARYSRDPCRGSITLENIGTTPAIDAKLFASIYEGGTKEFSIVRDSLVDRLRHWPHDSLKLLPRRPMNLDDGEFVSQEMAEKAQTLQPPFVSLVAVVRYRDTYRNTYFTTKNYTFVLSPQARVPTSFTPLAHIGFIDDLNRTSYQ